MNNPFIQSFLEAGWVGQGILVILFLGSGYSWTIILYKFFLFRRVHRATEVFLSGFKRGKRDILSLSSSHLSREIDPVYGVYQEGCRGLTGRGGKKDFIPEMSAQDWNRLEEDMQRKADAETRILEKDLLFLATAASTGPLLGILGTVYGVLIAFQGMGRYGSATIDAVAPGISEALITTVFGLVVAIPALIAYNHFKHFIGDYSARLDNFISDFITRARTEGTAEKRT
jgi:biopolymer transport protein TolQ